MRPCMPKCATPTWPTCGEPAVYACCFHLQLPDDLCDGAAGDWSCSTPNIPCPEAEGGTIATHGPVTNLTGVIGLPPEFTDGLDPSGSGWWGMATNPACTDLQGFVDACVSDYSVWWGENYITPFPGIGGAWLFIAWSCSGGKVTIEGRIGLEIPDMGVPSGCEGPPFRPFFLGLGWECAYWRAVVSPDWWMTIDPFVPSMYSGPLEIPRISGDGMPTAGPLKLSLGHDCTWVPCGDPLDCFASCVSGTVDCDGVTPAHKFSVTFLLDIDGCCLSGSHGLTYRESVTGPTGGYLGGKGYQGTASCDGGGGYTLLLHIVLYCLVPSTDDPNYNDGKGYLVLQVWFGVSSGLGTSWSLEIAEGVTMSCSDGAIVPITGTVTDTDCGTSGSGDWSLY